MMKANFHQQTHRFRLYAGRTSALVVALLCFGLAGAAPALAAPFESVGHFGGVVTPPPPAQFPEDVQLGGVGGMAVNVSGAGGVAPGTVYAATRGAGAVAVRVAMYEPGGASLAFKAGWDVTKTEGPYERCGPLLGTNCAPRSDSGAGAVDVEVDQTTGNVYVLSDIDIATGGTTVTVFDADGSEVITRFGEKAAVGEPTSTSQAKVHESPLSGGLAIDSSNGTVYIYDLNNFDNFYHRLMVFKPTTPGDFKTYAYVSGGDIAAGFFDAGPFPSKPVTDSQGDIYVAGEGYIEKFTPAQPTLPICKFDLSIGGITAMTVNRASGEPFYYTSKTKQVHRLSACSAGKFTAVPPAISLAPPRDNLFALAFDPARQLEPTREAGVLYGAAPGPVPGTGGAGQPGMGALGYIFAPAVPEADPVVVSQAVRGVRVTSAELEAEINPKGALTSYTFQYITEAAYVDAGEDFGEGTLEAPEGGALLGAGQSPLHAAAVLAGLAPDTGYRYRVIAESNCSTAEPEKVCKDIGETESFHTYPSASAGLPDNRAYELVSPPQKSGGQVLPADPITNSCGNLECKPGGGLTHFPMQSSPNGAAVVYEGTPFSAEGGAVIENEYISRRTATGWVTVNLTPPLLQSKGLRGYKAFDDDLQEGILEQLRPALSPAAPTEYDNLYRQPTASPLQLAPLVLATPPNRPPIAPEGAFATVYAGASADFSHLIFEANDALTPATALAPEAVAGGASENNLYESVGGALRLVNVLPDDTTIPGAVLGSGKALNSGNDNPTTVVTGAISDDGSRIFWTSKAGQLYVREDGEVTVEIEDSGKFLAASADGSKVLLSSGCLYDLAAKTCEDLTAGLGGFQGVAGHSEDLSNVYFVDTAVLTEDENDQGKKAQPGGNNLYAWDEGALGFVATLLASDNKVIVRDWQATPAVRTAEASPAGRFLAFLSTAQLTGVANVGPCALEGSSGKYVDAPCPEVFLYDSVTGALSCPSCNTSGSAPLGAGVLRLIKGPEGSLPQPRYLTDAGRLYFDSRDSLTYLDTNAGAEDVYQYEPQGVGSCKLVGGCVALISAGREASDSNFLALDVSGDNVFFTTRDRLVPADQDEQIDLYDARVGGGFATPAPPIPCSGEACQASTAAPFEPSPASGSPGSGNHKPPKCKQRKVRRGGRCVKRLNQKGRKKHSKAKANKRGGSK